jgi:hypothetical protein
MSFEKHQNRLKYFLKIVDSGLGGIRRNQMPLPVRAESRLPNRSPSAHLHQEADTTRVTAIVQRLRSKLRRRASIRVERTGWRPIPTLGLEPPDPASHNRTHSFHFALPTRR